MSRPTLVRASRGERGFTLVELALVLAVFTLLCCLGVSRMGEWNKQEKMKAAQLAVYQILQETRAQAISRGTNWSVSNTLVTAPFDYPLDSADLANFIQNVTNGEDMNFSVTPGDIMFDARGRCLPSNPVSIIISGEVSPDRTINVQASGMLSIPSS